MLTLLGWLLTFCLSSKKKAEFPGLVPIMHLNPLTHTHALVPDQVSPSRDQLTKLSAFPPLRSEQPGSESSQSISPSPSPLPVLPTSFSPVVESVQSEIWLRGSCKPFSCKSFDFKLFMSTFSNARSLFNHHLILSY